MAIRSSSHHPAQVLTHDALPTLFVAGALAVYGLYATGTALTGLSTRVVGLIVFAFGFAACASDKDEMEKMFSPATKQRSSPYVILASIVGFVAMTSGVGVLVTASEGMLDVLAGTIAILWVIATVRHASGAIR